MKKYLIKKRGKYFIWLDEHDGTFIKPNPLLRSEFTDKELAERLATEFGGKVEEIKDEQNKNRVVR
jgi:hypothetical protein